MSTENINTMGFEPAVEYDVPDFGKVHVLMKGGEPWFLSAELSFLALCGNAKGKGYIAAWLCARPEIRSSCVILPKHLLTFLGLAAQGSRRGLLALSFGTLKFCVQNPAFVKFAATAKVVNWAEKTFVLSAAESSQPPFPDWEGDYEWFSVCHDALTRISTGKVWDNFDAAEDLLQRIKELPVILEKAGQKAIAQGCYLPGLIEEASREVMGLAPADKNAKAGEVTFADYCICLEQTVRANTKQIDMLNAKIEELERANAHKDIDLAYYKKKELAGSQMAEAEERVMMGAPDFSKIPLRAN